MQAYADTSLAAAGSEPGGSTDFFAAVSPKLMRTCLYSITHTVSGKVYFGLTNDPDRRWEAHRYHPAPSSYIGKALKLHGADAFEFRVLEWFDLRHQAQKAERSSISAAQAAKQPLYNLTAGGESGNLNFGWTKKGAEIHTSDPDAEMLQLVESAVEFDRELEDDALCAAFDPHQQYPW